MTINVCLVDDQKLIRDGITNLLNLSDDIKVVAQAGDGQEFLQLVEDTPIDVILMDLSMPVMGGIETIKALNARAIKIPIIILTTFDDHELILEAIVTLSGFSTLATEEESLSCDLLSDSEDDSLPESSDCISTSAAFLLVGSISLSAEGSNVSAIGN